MSRRHFSGTDNAELRAKIDDAKRQLPLPDLMRQLGYPEKHMGETALCPFHDDQHPSFSVFQRNGAWFHRCFVGCSSGDEIAFLVKHFGISRREAIKRYLDMAGFPPRGSRKSHEYPGSPESRKSPDCPASPESRESRECPESLVSPVSPVSHVSNGQGLEAELKQLAGRNACTAPNTARRKRFKLARDLRAIELRNCQDLEIDQLAIAFNDWHRLSLPFLDPAKSRDDYWAAFLAELQKVRVPTGEGALKRALENVANLSASDLPKISGCPEAPESWRRVLALHRELSVASKEYTYFLSYRDAAKAVPGMSQQTTHNITLAFVRLYAIQIVRVGDVGPNGKRASEFRYLLPDSENGAEEDDGGLEI